MYKLYYLKEDKTMIPTRRIQGWLPEEFNDFFNTNWMTRTNATAPAINVLENKEEYLVEIAAPGMKKDNFNILLNQEGNLVISMEKKKEDSEETKEDKVYRYLRREFNYTRFEQTLIMPEDVEREKIKAKMTDGILTVCLPKIKEEETPKVSQNIHIE